MMLFQAYRSFGRMLIEKFSKEFDSIIDAIEILLTIHAGLATYNLDVLDDPELAQLVDNGQRSITELVETWFKKEFNESLMINFSLERTAREEIQQNEQLIQQYRSLLEMQDKSSMNNQEFDEGMMGMMRQTSRNPQEVRRHIHYYGLTNESEVMRRFYNIQLRNNDLTGEFRAFLIRKLFNDRVKLRINHGFFAEVIRFRIRFDADAAFGMELGEHFRHVLDKRIVEQLIGHAKSDSQHDLKTMCQQLSERTALNQELMDSYMNALLKNKVPAQPCSDYVDMEFMLEWNCLLTLLVIDLEHEARNRTRPLINAAWFTRFSNMLTTFAKTLNNIVDSTERIGFIKVGLILF
jgi:hypothetical protein